MTRGERNTYNNTIEEYTPGGEYVRTLGVPENTGSYAANGTEYLRGIGVTETGLIVGFDGTFTPQLTTYHAATKQFTAQTTSNWSIDNNGSLGSVGVSPSGIFVLTTGISSRLSAVLRFGPGGAVDRFGAPSDGRNYLNLTVGLDGKLYVLYAAGNPAATGSPYLVDVYDPASLQLLRTIALQVPSAHGSESTALRNLAVDASGTIYAIELYNYVYHLDASGALLQSASHGHGGYTDDIKIDPVSGHLLISVASNAGVILQTDASLSTFTPLIQFDPGQNTNSFITFGNAKLAAALNTTAHVLWGNTNGAISLWNYSRDTGGFTQNTYGPYPGWTVKAIADNPDGRADGRTRVLWNNINGAASIWSLDNGSGEFSQFTFGPYPGWTATGLSLSTGNTTHVLWNNSNGAASVWDYQTTDGSFTQNTYGPYPGWSAKSVADGAYGIADGPGSATRLLWTNTNGTMSLWNLNNSTGGFTQNTYGPYTGWTASAVSVDSEDTAHILWNNRDGRASVWNQQADEFGTFTQNTYGPYSGWSAKAIADGTDGQTDLLWTNTNGTMSLWNLDNSSGLFSQFTFGPYPEWTAIGVSSTF